jgi:hypothetical protein
MKGGPPFAMIPAALNIPKIPLAWVKPFARANALQQLLLGLVKRLDPARNFYLKRGQR